MKKKNKPDSPSTRIVDNIIKTGRLYASTKYSKTSGSRESIYQEETRNEYQDITIKDEYEVRINENGSIGRQNSQVDSRENHLNVVNTETSSMPAKFHKNGKISPNFSAKQERNNVLEKPKDTLERSTNPRKRNSADTVECDEQNNRSKQNNSQSTTANREQTQESKSRSDNLTIDNPDTSGQNEKGNIKTLDAILQNVNEISSYMKSQNENLQDTNIGTDIENEWKAMARTIDHLCMRFYIALLVISHVSILLAALVESSYAYSSNF